MQKDAQNAEEGGPNSAEKKPKPAGAKQEDEYEKPNKKKVNPFRIPGKKGKYQQNSFLSQTRDAIQDAFRNRSNPPPVGAYRSRFGGLDASVSTPSYGSKNRWDGHLAKRARQIKSMDFKNKVKKDPRLDRTLLYFR